MKLITHDGSFHADDTLAYAILSKIPRFQGADLIRTRDANLIQSAGGSDIVFDVGFEFDAVRNRFDHHMRDKPLREETFEGKPIPYSSVGLIWRFFGEEYLLANFDDIEGYIDEVWEEVDRTFILPTDMTDNGIGQSFLPTTLAVAVDDFNQAWDDETEYGNELFLQASEYAGQALHRRVEKVLSTARALGLATEAFATSPDPKIIVLPRPMPWEPAVYAGGFDEALYVISEKKGSWYCQAVRPEEGSFEQRLPLPEQWAGLEETDLAAVTGVEDAIFCHAMRFVCAARSLEGALALARMAVENKPAPTLK
jgi:Uncharacterized conserved protein related to MYG1 family